MVCDLSFGGLKLSIVEASGFRQAILITAC